MYGLQDEGTRQASGQVGVSGCPPPDRGILWTRTAGEEGVGENHERATQHCDRARLARLGVAPAEGVGAAVGVHHRVGRVDALEVLHGREGREALNLRLRSEPAGRAGEEVAVAARSKQRGSARRKEAMDADQGTHM